MDAVELKLKANSLFGGQEYSQAADIYSQALDLCKGQDKKQRATLLCNRSACYLKLKQLEKAYADAKKAQSLHREWARPYQRLGDIFAAKKLWDDALTHYESAQKRDKTNKNITASVQLSKRRIHEKGWDNKFQAKSERVSMEEKTKEELQNIMKGQFTKRQLEFQTELKNSNVKQRNAITKKINESIALERIVSKGHVARDNEKNDKKAWKYYMEAAKKGSANGQYCVAQFLYNGKYVDMDVEEAMKWLTRAAGQDTWVGPAKNVGVVEAQNMIGMIYRDKAEPDHKQAFKWFKESADNDMSYAANNLGVMYLNGVGIPKNIEKALQYFRKGAELGHSTSQFNLGMMYLGGIDVEVDIKEARKWLQLAADSGFPQALQALAHTDSGINDMFQHLKDAAVTGDPKSIFNLGKLYESGTNGAPKDVIEARKQYTLSAKGGCPEGQFAYAAMLHNGEGGDKDLKKAARYFQRAAQQGHTEAIFQMAMMVRGGIGETKRDRKDYISWLKFAAKKGHEEAQTFLRKIPSNEEWDAFDPAENELTLEERLAKIFPNGDMTPEEKEVADGFRVIENVKNMEPCTPWKTPGASHDKYSIEYLEQFPNSPTALKYLRSKTQFYEGVHQCAVGNHSVGLKDISEAIQVEQHHLGILNYVRRLIEKSTTTQLTKDPEDVDALVARAFLFQLSYDVTLRIMYRLIKARPENSSFYEHTGCILCFIGHWKEAIAAFTKAIELDPQIGYFYHRGVAYFNDDKYTKAKTDFIHFLTFVPVCERKVPIAYYFLGQLAVRFRNMAQIVLYYKKGLQAEDGILSCFRPVEHPHKDLLSTIANITPNPLKSKEREKYVCASCDGILAIPSTRRKCAGCKKKTYCSRKCQKKDWKRHKLSCKH